MTLLFYLHQPWDLIIIPPANPVCGGGVILFSHCPFINLSIHNILVLQYLEKAMTEFHKIWETHWYPQDEHLWLKNKG